MVYYSIFRLSARIKKKHMQKRQTDCVSLAENEKYLPPVECKLSFSPTFIHFCGGFSFYTGCVFIREAELF